MSSSLKHGALAILMAWSAIAVSGNPAKQAESMIRDAEQARQKAASVGGEWRDTARFIEQAKAAAKEGGYDEAMRLARKAKREGEMGYAQAMEQKGKIQVPSYLRRR